MRIFTLVSAALAVSALSLSAAPVSNQHPVIKKSVTTEALQKATPDHLGKAGKFAKKAKVRPVAKADGEKLQMDWGYCEDPYIGLQLETFHVQQAIKVYGPELTTLDGATMDAVVVGNPFDSEDIDEETWTMGNPIRDVKVWVKEALDAEPVVAGSGTLTSVGLEWSTVQLDATYTISKDKPFYIGVEYDLPTYMDGGEEVSDCYGYISDYGWPDIADTNLIYTRANGIDDEGYFTFGDEAAWTDFGDLLGYACIRAHVYGDNLPTNILKITDKYVTNYVRTGDEIEVLMQVQNKGANVIDSVDLTLTYDDGTVQTQKCDISGFNWDYELEPMSIGYNGYGLVDAWFSLPENQGYSNCTVTLGNINGAGVDNNADSKLEWGLLYLDEGAHKNLVVEEATGLWCGWCVVGYAGMKYLAENYEDCAIGIALHSGDPMTVFTDAEFDVENGAYDSIESNISGFPSAFYNRDFSYDGYPSPEYIDEDIANLRDIPAVGELTATLSPVEGNEKQVRLDVESTYVLDNEDGMFGIAYTVVEDGVGPYKQTNYLSGEADEDSYGFGSLDSKTPLIFNDVARNCSHITALEGSTEAKVVKGEKYQFSTVIELTDVNKLDNYRVVPMIVNNKFGFVENACVVKSPSYNYNSVKTVSAESLSKLNVRSGKGCIYVAGDTTGVKVYSADGCKAGVVSGYRTNLPAGFYIVTRGNEAVKVLVK